MLFRVSPLLCLVAVLLAGPAAAYSVRADHPRILLNEDMLPALRTRCQTTHAGIFNRLVSLVDRRIGENRKDARYVDDYAFVWLMTQDTRYRDFAIQSLLWCVQNNQEVVGEGTAVGRLSSVAIAYDWMYDAMTPTDRATVAGALAVTVRNDMHDYDDRYVWLPIDNYYPYALAIFGDGVADTEAAEGFGISYDRFVNAYIPAMDEVGTFGSVDGYGGVRTEFMFVFAEVLRSAVSEDWASQSSFIRNSGQYWMSRLRGDLRWMRNPGKWNMENSNKAVYFSYFASAFDNPYWQAFANRFVNDWTVWDELSAWHLILWYDPSQQSIAVPDTLSYHCTGSGMTYMRDNWNFGPTSRTIHAGFFNGPDLVHSFSQNSFIIARGSDNLIIDSGKRLSDVDDHYMPYYVRAIAHNAVLIDNPSENLGTYENVYHEHPAVPNEGEQNESDAAQGLIRWPHAGTYGYRGEITGFVDDGDYVYVRGDATHAYRNKSSRVLREFVYLRPDIFVIRDLVNRNAASYRTKVVYHMIDRPLVSGNWTVVAGNLATGGVFESATQRSAMVYRGNSQCEIRFITPATQGTMRIVGGANPSGLAWRQSWQPRTALTYNAQTSYEFYVDGKNYPPGAQYCDQEKIDERNTDEPSNEAGDWRVELEAPATGTDVTFLTVLRVGAHGAPSLSVIHRETETGDAVVIARAAGDTVVVAFKKESGLDEVRY